MVRAGLLSPGADVGTGEPSFGADVARSVVSQRWLYPFTMRRPDVETPDVRPVPGRCGWRRCAPSPGAEVAGAGPVPTLRRRCGRGESSPGADVGARLAHEVGAGKLLDELILLRLLVQSGEPCTARLVKRMYADIPGDRSGRQIDSALLTRSRTCRRRKTNTRARARTRARTRAPHARVMAYVPALSEDVHTVGFDVFHFDVPARSHR